MKRVIYKTILGTQYTIIDGLVMVRKGELGDWRVSAFGFRLGRFHAAVKKGEIKEVKDVRD